MNKLPVEILNGIFSLLHQSDQVECMTVCRKWESTIKSDCLLRTVYITSKNQIEKLKKLLEQEPSQGERVERLVLNVMLNLSFDLASFLKLIPNPHIVFIPTANKIKSMESNWNKYLGFYEINSHHVTYQLLRSGVYSCLESLMVYGYELNISTSIFIDALKNAPALKRLKMGHFSISPKDLELLHKNVPTLCSLNLEPVSLLEHMTLPATEITPMTSLTSLGIYLNPLENITHVTNIIQYISQKYSKLSKFDIWIANDLEHEKAHTIYQNGLVPLLRTYGPTLKDITIFLTESPQNLFNVLENVNYHLQSLEIQLISHNWNNKPLERKSHLQHLQTLKLVGISPTSDFDWLKDYTNLKELELTFSYPSITMEEHGTVSSNKFLEACPKSLESITLINVQLIYELSSIPLLPLVKKLEIRFSSPAIGFDSFISKALPNLRFLRFEYCELAYKRLSFPNLDLDCLGIVDIVKLEKDHLLVTTLHDNRQSLYAKSKWSCYGVMLEQIFPKHDNTIYPASKLIRDGLGAGEKPFISVECNTVKHVIY